MSPWSVTAVLSYLLSCCTTDTVGRLLKDAHPPPRCPPRVRFLLHKDGDILIHCGDFSTKLYQRDFEAAVEDFDRFLASLGHRHKVNTYALCALL